MNEPRQPLEKREPRHASQQNPKRSSASQRSDRVLPPTKSWIPAIAAVTVLIVVVVAGAFGDDDHDGGAVAGGSSSSSSTSASSTSSVDTASGDSSYGITGLTIPASTLPGLGTDAALAPVAKTTLSQSLVP